MTAALKRIVEAVEQLSETELRELQELLRRTSADAARPMTEAEFEEKLAAEGLLTLPTSARSVGSGLPSPIMTRGRPLSEILLEERR